MNICAVELVSVREADESNNGEILGCWLHFAIWFAIPLHHRSGRVEWQPRLGLKELFEL